MSTLPPCLTPRLGPLPASYIDPATRAVADAAVRVARARLGLPWVDVRWFVGTYAPAFVYGPEPTVVWLSDRLEDCAPAQVAEITAHECSHVADALAGRPDDEAKALAFGQAVAVSMFGPQ